MSMSLADLAWVVIVSLAGSGTMAGVYLKLSEQWLNQKSDQVKALADDSFFSLIESLGAPCEARKKYMKKKADEDITTEEYSSLLDSIAGMKAPLDEYERMNGCLFRMSRKLRNGAMLWIGVFAVAAIYYVIAYAIEATGMQSVLQAIYADMAISIAFALAAILLAAFAFRPLFATLRELNSIDAKSESIERIRTWKKRT